MTKPHVKLDFKETELPGVTKSFQKDDQIPVSNVGPWFFKTVTSAPSAPPAGWWEQIQIYYGVGVELYVWSTYSNQWYHVAF